MAENLNKKIIIFSIIAVLLFSHSTIVLSSQVAKSNIEEINVCEYSEETKYIEIEIDFSTPEVVPYWNSSVVRVNETNHNRMVMFDYNTSLPVLPVNLSVFNLPFGTKILDVDFEHTVPETIELIAPLIYTKVGFDSIKSLDFETENSDEIYPENWVLYHTGGGLSYGERTTYLVVRVYPVRYYPVDSHLKFISNINVNISYVEPAESLIQPQYERDLLIIAPSSFKKDLQPLVCFKEQHGVKTELYSVKEICCAMKTDGRDTAEKIKYFIKDRIEKCDIKNVLLVGGIKGQGFEWNLPIRYSFVVPTEEQEYPEQRFVSDLYYADIYDSEGKFSSWDSDLDDKFSVWNEELKDEMDLYPDVYLGRLPCRNTREVKTIVNKIINYERNSVKDEDWFKNILLVAGDSYVNNGTWPADVLINEGELAGEAAEEIMNASGFTALEVYTSEQDISGKTVNKEFNKGAGFAYFCGHGSSVSWSTHFPPAVDKKSNWTTGYNVEDMILLKNQEKLPVTIVGGCHNGEFNKSISMKIQNGIKNQGLLKYFIKGRFFFDGWAPNCWAWWLTSKSNGGAIATIANTGLGTHGDGDQDFNGVIDYLEILDGWLELRFLELYSYEGQDHLGLNHGETMTGYLHKFLGDDAKMDVKMVQQWGLFGDPSLKIGGYEE